MTPTTLSASASSAPIRSFEKIVGQAGEATSRNRCPVFAFEAYTAPPPPVPANHTTISQLLDEWETDDQGRAALESGRRWVAETFYREDGDTVRTLRLKMGWSQTRLADALGTSQSHIARIERGTENLTIETCRKLATALDIDLNALDQALKRQEAIAQAKQK
ncbi:helix-turn-helix domain-containing protein [Thiocystis violascens]|uniref:Putative transcriptional regulator with C-terminal CBS domains n=1 Tax=Thiocystis violascens (strain ATCC 17096 / DSM 198 / 6111) TaxID=765911 RepID=I3Y963_THIV6|nr:helix-turn-helix transcriptional regulator [Thiocystis violascens]AFL73531.1 putative transcriptional regulator with C-terminal CBS domains [Thiocystis violascens DSM 198]